MREDGIILTKKHTPAMYNVLFISLQSSRLKPRSPIFVNLGCQYNYCTFQLTVLGGPTTLNPSGLDESNLIFPFLAAVETVSILDSRSPQYVLRLSLTMMFDVKFGLLSEVYTGSKVISAEKRSLCAYSYVQLRYTQEKEKCD